ncbi:MAG: hypothetical protein ACOZD0_13585 [Pseudomonadota bacterium]
MDPKTILMVAAAAAVLVACQPAAERRLGFGSPATAAGYLPAGWHR